MVAARVIGREQQKDEVDWLAVVRFVLDRLLQPREEADDALEAPKLDVRDGDAAPQPVEPRRSRCSSVLKISRASRLVRSAAIVASSCNACFLLVACSEAMMPSGARRSHRSIAKSHCKRFRNVVRRSCALRVMKAGTLPTALHRRTSKLCSLPSPRAIGRTLAMPPRHRRAHREKPKKWHRKGRAAQQYCTPIAR